MKLTAGLNAMKRGYQCGWLFATLLAGLVTLLPASVQTTNSSGRSDYSAFKIITDRNIFNPQRRARVNGQEPKENNRPAIVDSFALVGTMSYEKGAFAFFDGSSAEYRKVVKPTEAIAGYKVTDIEPAAVKLASPTNELELKVGSQMRREDSGQWHIAAAAEPATAGTAGTSGESNSQASSASLASQTATNGATTSASGVDDAVLKRLMERRNQEINR